MKVALDAPSLLVDGRDDARAGLGQLGDAVFEQFGGARPECLPGDLPLQGHEPDESHDLQEEQDQPADQEVEHEDRGRLHVVERPAPAPLPGELDAEAGPEDQECEHQAAQHADRPAPRQVAQRPPPVVAGHLHPAEQPQPYDLGVRQPYGPGQHARARPGEEQEGAGEDEEGQLDQGRRNSERVPGQRPAGPDRDAHGRAWCFPLRWSLSRITTKTTTASTTMPRTALDTIPM
ncbi:hypothetical protein [Streptosporangium lutulentum]|uniref:Uncharacterized protein n=1 Tax=Streptosporangium lutulentum TaxID=1461250 RepID=A0ABT9QBQ3_9ACTN|nr:hypothetical protein [Streptosporangium lutulentum]MDP9844139.1 hypothetical protein [Streptosporangium lutulentum]